jgi:hypothetical protein
MLPQFHSHISYLDHTSRDQNPASRAAQSNKKKIIASKRDETRFSQIMLAQLFRKACWKSKGHCLNVHRLNLTKERHTKEPIDSSLARQISDMKEPIRSVVQRLTTSVQPRCLWMRPMLLFPLYYRSQLASHHVIQKFLPLFLGISYSKRVSRQEPMRALSG